MRRLRFSVFDLFVVTLGASAGLAYHRLPGVGWSDALLVICATWIVMGMVQQMRTAYDIWRSVPSTDRELRNGAALAVARPIAVVAMLALSIAFGAVPNSDQAGNYFGPPDAFTSSLISLAVIGAYTSPGLRHTPNLPLIKTKLRAWFDSMALLIGAGWLLYIIVSAQTISGLIHIAIRGVEYAQPTRWNGKPFYTFDPQVKLGHDFFWGGILAVSAASICAVSTLLLTVYWDRRTIRRLLITSTTLCFAVAAYWLHWCWTVGYPSLSPYLAAQTGKQPWHVVAAGICVAAAACFLFVMRYVPQPLTSESGEFTLPPAYHFSNTIMSLLLIAMVVESMPIWWADRGGWMGNTFLVGPFYEFESWWNSGARLIELPLTILHVAFGTMSYWLEQPKMLLRFAAILVVTTQMWRCRSGQLPPEAITRVNSAKFASISILSAATLLIAVPAGAWLGFAIVTTSFAGP